MPKAKPKALKLTKVGGNVDLKWLRESFAEVIGDAVVQAVNGALDAAIEHNDTFCWASLSGLSYDGENNPNPLLVRLHLDFFQDDITGNGPTLEFNLREEVPEYIACVTNGYGVIDEEAIPQLRRTMSAFREMADQIESALTGSK